MLGSHWIADANGCDESRFTRDSIRDALIGLPDALGLIRVAQPQVFEHVGTNQESTTLAGIVLISESHVSVHCFTEHAAAHVDVFSCRQLDLSVARDFVERHFRAREVVEKVLERGEVRTLPARVRRVR